jgi:hypothetical protein
VLGQVAGPDMWNPWSWAWSLELHMYMCVCVCVFFFGRTGAWTQGFALARQAFYLLSQASSPFSLWLFGELVSCFLHSLPEQQTSYFMLPVIHVTGMMSAPHCAQL